MKESRMNIYVGNLPYAATETDLEELFQEYGPVATATVIRDRNDGRSKGFGFVEMENQEDGERAIEALDGEEMMGRPLKVNPARPREQRREPRSDDGHQNDHNREPELPDSDFFHNPYTFVPTPPREKAIKHGGFAGDFDPLKNGLDHASLKSNLWTGHIPIKLTTVTPLVLLKDDSRERDPKKHQTYDVLDYIPESSLRGMLRSAYEVVTNSRYGCFGNDHKEKLAYRMDPGEAPKLIPAIIKKDTSTGNLKACLYTGTSTPTHRGPKRDGSDQERAMYAAMLNQDLEYVHGGLPKTGHTVWAQIVLRKHDNPSYLYWAATKVWSTEKQPSKPAQKGDLNDPNVRMVKGHVFITNENIKKKHDERIFFYDNPNMTQAKEDITHIHEAWEKLIKNYRDAHTGNDIFGRPGAYNEPWTKIGEDPGETAWSPHLYQDSEHQTVWRKDPRGRATTHDTIKLQEGDMVYARCEFTGNTISGIKDLFPVTISRELYAKSPKDLLDDSLQPAKVLDELSPADRLFGWVPQNTEQDDDTASENESGYKSRIRVVCEDGPQPEIVQSFDGRNLPLTILGQPKPPQGRFYVAKDKDGNPQKSGYSKEAAGYSNGKGLRGRKQYWHHRGLEAERDEKKQKQCYWQPSVEDRTQIKRKDRYQEYRRPDNRPDEHNPHGGWQQTDSQNRSITGWIRPYTKFKASLYVQNLEPKELGALLWLLTLNEGKKNDEKHYFRLGYGKPLGFGSVTMEIDWKRSDCSNEWLPLGTGKDWKAHYAVFNANASSPEKVNHDEKSKLIKQFKKSMEEHAGKFDKLSFIEGFRQVLIGPVTDAPIHYPRLEYPEQGQYKPNPEGRNFEWFTDNERGIKRDEDGRRCVLPNVTGKDGLPYKPTKPK